MRNIALMLGLLASSTMMSHLAVAQAPGPPFVNNGPFTYSGGGAPIKTISGCGTVRPMRGNFTFGLIFLDSTYVLGAPCDITFAQGFNGGGTVPGCLISAMGTGATPMPSIPNIEVRGAVDWDTIRITSDTNNNYVVWHCFGFVP